NNDATEMIQLLDSGLDPNFEGGWPIRLAARHGSCSIVKTLLDYGSNPHLLSESGASTLQLAVYSRKHWFSDKWCFLLSSCDSSQLADGAAVAIIFQNIAALEKIVGTGRCNTNIPTSLTGKTVEDLAKGYKLQHIFDTLTENQVRYLTPHSSPRVTHNSRDTRAALTPTQEPIRNIRNLSPSVAQFFNQTSTSTPRSNLVVISPTTEHIHI
ncbi:uncharacterized protein LOC106143002, partial [Amyelois transitella]|uniref:uncharacterized protein LOC106143002 n=1 Tax=Amyelois transitella TaxID=680683 RepID=UPI00298FA48E